MRFGSMHVPWRDDQMPWIWCRVFLSILHWCCLTTWPDGHNLKRQGCFRSQSDDQISASPYVSKGHPAITKGIQRYLWLVMNITTLCHGKCSFCLMSDIGGLLRLCGLRHCYSMSSTMLWKRGAFLKASGTTRWPHRRVFGGPNADIWASCLTGTPGTEVWHKAARKNNKKSGGEVGWVRF